MTTETSSDYTMEMQILPWLGCLTFDALNKHSGPAYVSVVMTCRLTEKLDIEVLLQNHLDERPN